MKKYLNIILLLVITSGHMHGQVNLKNSDQIKGFSIIPDESVFVHFNSSLLLTGEYLFYKAYCLNTKTGRLSNLSKIAYVELVGKDGALIFKQKIKLENGQGNGDFFIPVSAPSGSYKILAYTNWMKNGIISKFFQSEIHIINPYQTRQNPEQVKQKYKIDSLGSIAILNDEKFSNDLTKMVKGFVPLNILLEKQNFNKRSKVSIVLKSEDSNKIPIGDYSISVRKKGNITEPKKISATSFFENYKPETNNFIPSVGSVVYLPELRGELISGRVTTLNKELDVKNLKVALSIPGENYYFEIAQTNELGDFYINIDHYYSGDKAILQILGENRKEFSIKLNDHKSVDYSSLKFNDFIIDPSMRDEILQRSIHNQIESAYFSFKPDSVSQVAQIQLFDAKKVTTYNLDNFTRFINIKETVLEIIKNVWVNKINRNDYVFEIQGFNFSSKTGILPLVIVDGMVIQNHTAIINYDARNIGKISVFRDQIVFGPEIYQGAIVFETINGNYDQSRNDPSVLVSAIFKPQPNKKYFLQRHEDSQNLKLASRIPDDRLQLLWNPRLRLTEKETIVDFYTSDVEGEFEIYIDGFTEEGKPVSICKSIYVK